MKKKLTKKEQLELMKMLAENAVDVIMAKPKLVVYNEKNGNGIKTRHCLGRVTYDNNRNAVIKNVCPIMEDIHCVGHQFSVVNQYDDKFDYVLNTIEKRMIKINADDFHIYTEAYYTNCDTPERDYDFISPSGSKYWIYDDYIIRKSNHWGNVASCKWYLDGVVCNTIVYDEEKSGMVMLKDMKRRPMALHKLLTVDDGY